MSPLYVAAEPIEVESTGGPNKATFGVYINRYGRLALRVEGSHGCNPDEEQEASADVTVADLERLLVSAQRVVVDGSVAPDGTIYYLGVDLLGPTCDYCGEFGENDDVVTAEGDGAPMHEECRDNAAAVTR